MIPVLELVSVNGVELGVWTWPGEGPPLLFAHATGFHARVWDQVLRRLPGRQRIAVDMRGHGASQPIAPVEGWRPFGDDLVALVAALDLRGVIGVGHSMGGFALALAAALAPERFARLLLLDPVIMPRTLYGQRPTEHFAARRRNQWHSPQEMYERFHTRPPFNHWHPDVLHDYCHYGLRRDPHGHGLVLACNPAVEHSIYMACTATDIYPELARVSIPVRIMRFGEPMQLATWDMAGSPTAPDLARAFPNATDEHFPEADHYLPMVDPARVATWVWQTATHVAP